MANRLSLQSATCSAFQLQLCRQPHNEKDTKTVSSFGSDCTRAMQSPPRNPTTWWAITRLQLIHRLCWCLCENSMNEKESIFLCLCVHLHITPLYSTVWNRACLSRRGEERLTVLQWCIPPLSGCTALLLPPHYPAAQRRTGPGSSLEWWPACLPPEVLPLGSPIQGKKELIVRWSGILCTMVLRYSISLSVFSTTLWLWLNRFCWKKNSVPRIRE